MNIDKFCELTKWDSRYSSSVTTIHYDNYEALVIRDLQFHTEKHGWIYSPRIIYRGSLLDMKFPIIATNSKMEKCVVITNEEELAKYGEMWRNKDFSMFDTPIEREMRDNEDMRSYTDIQRGLYRLLSIDKNVIYISVDGYNDTPKWSCVLKVGKR